MKQARTGLFGAGKEYDCLKDWPEDCFVQCGGHGLVLNKGSMEEVFNSDNPLQEVEDNVSYTTAFFEAFPKSPSTFIRGEGSSIEDAEASAFAKFEKYAACDHPEFEKKGYKNGYGFCVECGMGRSGAFEPEYKCKTCGQPTYYAFDIHDNPFCEEHWADVPWDDLPKHTQAARRCEEN